MAQIKIESRVELMEKEKEGLKLEMLSSWIGATCGTPYIEHGKDVVINGRNPKEYDRFDST